MHVLVIYDNTGKIWGMYDYDGDVAPAGLQAIVCDVPVGYHLYGVDVENASPLFEEEQDPYAEIQESIDDLFAIVLNGGGN